MQKLQNDCGVAVIKTILEQNKLIYEKKNLQVNLPDNGLSLQDIVNTFSEIGVESSPFEVEDFEELKKINHSYIALINQNTLNHYIVVHHFDDKNKLFTISNPSSVDTEKISEERFKALFLGYIIVIEKISEKKQKNRSTNTIIEGYKEVVSALNKSKKVELIILTILKFLLPLAFYQLLQSALLDNFEILNPFNLVLYFTFYISFFIGTYLLGIRFSELKLSLENSFQRKIVEDYYYLNMSDITNGKNMDNMIGYLSTLMQGASGLVERFFLTFDIIFAIFLVFLMYLLHFSFPIIFLVISLIYGFYTFKQLNKILNYQQNLATSFNSVLSTFESNVLGSLDIKISEKEEEAYNHLYKNEKNFFDAKYLDALLQNKITILSNVSTFLMIVMILFVTFISLKYSGNILYPLSSGLYVFFIVSSLIESIIQSFLSYQMSYISIEYVQSIKNFINHKPNVGSKKIELHTIHSIVLENLVFSHKETVVLNELNLSLKAGDCVSISGKNGAGKTTLTKILLGILTPNSGNILINNNPIDDLSKTDIISQINYYSPEQHIFYGSMENNIAMNMFKDTNIQVTQSMFSQDMDMNKIIYQGGSNISQGQKQKILLNRCFYQEKNIYILDEPSGNLDFQAKKELINKIIELKQKGKIIVVVSHDEELLKECTTNLKLEEGKLSLHE